jgi:hypothetical protein
MDIAYERWKGEKEVQHLQEELVIDRPRLYVHAGPAGTIPHEFHSLHSNKGQEVAQDIALA